MIFHAYIMGGKPITCMNKNKTKKKPLYLHLKDLFVSDLNYF